MERSANSMKRKFNKVISFTLVLCFAFSIGITTGAAKTNEIKGHWAEETLNEWIKLDLLRGDSNGKYNPNDDITRAEFMTLVNRMMNYTEKSKDIKKYIDVSPEKWYYDDCAKALAAG